MNIKAFASVAALALAGTIVAGSAQARDQIQIVGSSTVFPFATAVAEQFGQKTTFKTPVVESTGSGGGIKLFCEGVGENTPDITNASRRMKAKELVKCNEAGVTPVEVTVGFDGIVLANSKAGTQLDLTLSQIFLALAKEVPVDGKLVANPYNNWSDIDPALPNSKIEVLGPPPTSGTRDAFAELAMAGGCKMLPGAKELGLKKKACHVIREDGAYIEAGENDNLIVQKLDANPNALGIFGFSFLDQNADKIQGTNIAGIAPTFDAIAAGDYPVSRSLYFYIKKEHVGVIPGIAEYLAEFTNEDTWGDEGYLADKGLIPLPTSDREAISKSASALTALAF
ncbi:PstS family phosphate ABC transporter substrate-binding protein [Pseudovibrio sp. Tun.PSC04-5.I4]|uniref:PstS family phosphate ABC transporter substrate-binding protein n=1 Tax=Pseudovibrio sp. Tun.PSC04-5.I4 TaxID=1798213 RepID=UPI000890B379|nr:PstS family phosphate ABC transporter substrate-binding protein [Pseudovibrio sp. Tun.PSC04-5.I4]SDQ82997.1 phosphate ABC transporter substrate-binding protein, PhoT family [Pseudovibrio sp. Tun.PSC04-5.I4]